MKTNLVLLTIFFAQFIVIENANADLILNGGFESPPGGGLNIGPGSEPAGMVWSVLSGTVDIGPLPFVPFVLYSAFEGTQILDLNGDQRGAIGQSFSTVAGSTYTLSFQYADNPDEGGISAAEISVFDVLSSTSLLSASVSHSTSTNSPIFADWTLFSNQFVATGTQSRLSFTSTSASNTASGGIFLDAVSVSAVPEPSSFILLGFATIGLGLRYRSRGRATSHH